MTPAKWSTITLWRIKLLGMSLQIVGTQPSLGFPAPCSGVLAAERPAFGWVSPAPDYFLRDCSTRDGQNEEKSGKGFEQEDSMCLRRSELL